MENKAQDILPSKYMKALKQSLIFNSFATNFQFSKDLGLEILKGPITDDQAEALKKSILGLQAYINLIEEKLEEMIPAT